MMTKLDMDRLTAQLKELKELRAMRDDLADQITAIEDEIKGAMDRQGLTTLAMPAGTATYKIIASKRFDTTAFRADHERMYTQYLKDSDYKRFTVK
ncbi:hypothetical protein [Pyramidobacter piscolens]|uniref:hypothetical protein n=1 Tax=Pyramidobacter piscolens TaxID=638849 RepID=UPI001FCC85DC|nr:hypothetical protein [Pyramidobacter piscolens]BDF78643.1 hypothetical protein CE91St28_14370 [Pyramidobacter piscolens]